MWTIVFTGNRSTSRTEERWLGGLRRMPVGGLAPEEANLYADELLEPYPGAVAHRAVREFADLLQWLDRHPLSMRLILSHLNTITPGALLEASARCRRAVYCPAHTIHHQVAVTRIDIVIQTRCAPDAVSRS
jgi:hypothetical protein